MTPAEQQKFDNYSHASRLRMANTSKADRVLRARNAAKALHASRTPEQRKTLALKMVEARQNKWLKP